MKKFKYPEEFFVGYGGLRAEKIINENEKKMILCDKNKK